MDLTREELASLLSKIDDVMREARELSQHIKTTMGEQAGRNRVAPNWPDRRARPERRKRQRG